MKIVAILVLLYIILGLLNFSVEASKAVKAKRFYIPYGGAKVNWRGLIMRDFIFWIFK